MPEYASAPALRSYLENQVHFYTELSRKSCDALAALSKLNLHLAEQLLTDAANTGRELVQCPHPALVAPTLWRHAVPLGEHWRSYQQALWSMLSGAQTGLAQSARAQLTESGRSAAAMASDFARQHADGQAYTRH